MSSMTADYVNQEEEEGRNANVVGKPAGIEQQFLDHDLFRSC